MDTTPRAAPIRSRESSRKRTLPRSNEDASPALRCGWALTVDSIRPKITKRSPTGGLAKSVSGVSLVPPGCQKSVQTSVRQKFGFWEHFPECPKSVQKVSKLFLRENREYVLGAPQKRARACFAIICMFLVKNPDRKRSAGIVPRS